MIINCMVNQLWYCNTITNGYFAGVKKIGWFYVINSIAKFKVFLKIIAPNFQLLIKNKVNSAMYHISYPSPYSFDFYYSTTQHIPINFYDKFHGNCVIDQYWNNDK